MKRFHRDFGRGVSCTVQVADTPPTDQSSPVRETHWTWKAGPQHLRAHIGWMNSVNKEMADQWGVRLMHVFLVGNGRIKPWVYEPGEPPKGRSP
jgi:hypothetical protein